jgi:hypothetical protein
VRTISGDVVQVMINLDFYILSIFQFLYGEDGLDPMNIEAADRPFNLDKLLKFSKALIKLDYSKERALFPFEIIDLSWRKIKNFENQIHEFILL